MAQTVCPRASPCVPVRPRASPCVPVRPRASPCVPCVPVRPRASHVSPCVPVCPHASPCVPVCCINGNIKKLTVSVVSVCLIFLSLMIEIQLIRKTKNIRLLFRARRILPVATFDVAFHCIHSRGAVWETIANSVPVESDPTRK